MSPEFGFVGSLAGTVMLLLLVVYTGLKAMRRLHLPLVALTVAALAASIVYALKLGKLYDLETAGVIYPVHTTIARVATLAYVLPLTTGILTLRNPRRRKLHGRVAVLVVVLTVAAALTGAMMMVGAEHLPDL